MERNNIYIQIIRFLCIVVCVSAFAYAFYIDMGFVRSLSFTYDIVHDSPVISSFFPYGRIERNETEGYVTDDIIVEPVYVDVRIPMGYEKMKLEMEYRTHEQDLVQVGALKDAISWGYELSTVDYKKLNDLKWKRLEKDGYVLWQRDKKYSSIDDFVSHVRDEKGVVYYSITDVPSFKIRDYKVSDKRLVMNNSLRGAHQFYTYIGNEEPLDTKIIFQDINRNIGPDIVSVSIYDMGGNLKFNQVFADDGLVSDKDPATPKRIISLYQTGLSEGAYRIEVQCNDDILIRGIDTAQQYITFINKIYPVDSREYADGLIDLKFDPSIVFTNSNTFLFKTHHKLGLQTVRVGEFPVEIANTFTPVGYSNEKQENTLLIPLNDVIVTGNGLFSFSRDTFFNPKEMLLGDTTNFDSVRFIYAKYIIPQNIDDIWRKIETTFNLSNIAITKGTTRLIVSSPYLNERNERLRVRKIKVSFFKEKAFFWKNIKTYYNAFMK